ncbi:MAG: NAD(P)/FAD-dependent oxidoreductase [Candidatus Thermoplasmatota archaeon]|nr:NAD(P)/FAD-dependent oxidoreductase [Candidatus Thermoplasmatota archaeon]
MIDALVVGAGPSGCRAAWKLAEAGYSVAIAEEHERVGDPCQCAGLVTPRTLDYLGYRLPVLQEMRGARLWGPYDSYLEFEALETKALVIDRPALDRSIAARAEKAGAEIWTGTRYTRGWRDNGGMVAELRDKSGMQQVQTRLLIGADGPASRVARDAGLHNRREVMAAFGGDVSGYATRDGYVDLFVGSELAPRFFGWAIPTGSDTGRLGVATTLPHRPRKFFRSYFHEGAPSKVLNGAKLTARISGLIPFGLREPAFTDHVLLIGDAAGLAKPTSGGGIYTGLVSADAAAETAIAAFEAGDLSVAHLAEYQQKLRNRIAGELQLGARLRRAFLALDDAQLAEIIRMLGDPAVLEAIQRVGDLDYTSRAAFAVLKAQPKLVKFAPLLLKPFV